MGVSGWGSPMPEMVDTFGRVVRDLRVSVTDRCNFRCLYCMPEDGLPWLAKDDVLGRDELIRALRVAIELGVRTVRVTGGEPTLRRDLVDVVAALGALGVELSITTNGFLMDRLAEPLRRPASSGPTSPSTRSAATASSRSPGATPSTGSWPGSTPPWPPACTR